MADDLPLDPPSLPPALDGEGTESGRGRPAPVISRRRSPEKARARRRPRAVIAPRPIAAIRPAGPGLRGSGTAAPEWGREPEGEDAPPADRPGPVPDPKAGGEGPLRQALTTARALEDGLQQSLLTVMHELLQHLEAIAARQRQMMGELQGLRAWNRRVQVRGSNHFQY